MVSVIIPMYNAGKQISRCITSIAAQTYNDIELVIVNDGSTDDSLIQAENLCDSLVQFKYKIISQNNSGQNSARLSGCMAAAGDYITFIDADDWVEPDFIQSLVDSIDVADITMQGAFINSDDGSLLDIECNQADPGIYCGLRMKELILDSLCVDLNSPFHFGILPYLCNKLFRRELILSALENVDKRITDGEDVAILTACLLQAKKVAVTNDARYHYVIYPQSMSHKRHDNYMNATYLYQQLYKEACASEYKDILLPQINQYMRMMIQKEDPYQYLTLNRFWFPYADLNKGSNIILYGAGNMGKAFYMENSISNYCHIVAWIDRNPSVFNYREDAIRQMQIGAVTQYKYDKILIAIANPDIQHEVMSDLIDIGVDYDKILPCNDYGD